MTDWLIYVMLLPSPIVFQKDLKCMGKMQNKDQKYSENIQHKSKHLISKRLNGVCVCVIFFLLKASLKTSL